MGLRLTRKSLKVILYHVVILVAKSFFLSPLTPTLSPRGRGERGKRKELLAIAITLNFEP
jgi:hypothetical protein